MDYYGCSETALLMRSVFHASYWERHKSNSVDSGSNVCNKSVMIKFTCQHDWAMGYPESWLNLIPGSVCEDVSGRD